MVNPFKIFICYAREDHSPLEMLRKKLVPLESGERVQLWYDREITGGKVWDDEIRFNLKTADIVLLLISDDFFDSKYINKVEMKEALAGHARQETIVVPIILHDCVWDAHPELARLQALPAEAKPVFDERHWRTPADGFNNVVRGILRILDDPDTEARRTRKNARLEAAQQAEAAEQRRLEREAQAAEQKRKEAEAAEQHRLQQEQARAAAARAAASEEKRLEEEAARQKGLPDMVLVKGGTFQMGSNENDREKPVHPVILSDFEIGKYPVTQKLWQDIMGGNPSHFKGDDLPVENVSWDDCQEFLKKLNVRFPGKKYRLPTEAEWEFAARGGIQSKGFQYAGSNDLKEVGWFSENSDSKTHPVGQKKANGLGVHDMSGNVWEWCNDWYGVYPSAPQTNPKGLEKGSLHVMRGGSWGNAARQSRTAYRGGLSPSDLSDRIGFRLVLSL